MKVRENIVSEINRIKGKEKQLENLKKYKEETANKLFEQSIGLQNSVPKISYNFENQNADGKPNSRYRNDFEEIWKIGRGGGGHVYQVIHKIDNIIYAVK